MVCGDLRDGENVTVTAGPRGMSKTDCDQKGNTCRQVNDELGVRTLCAGSRPSGETWIYQKFVSVCAEGFLGNIVLQSQEYFNILDMSILQAYSVADIRT